MIKIRFRYKDEYSHGEWREQECTVSSMDECIKLYGLDNVEHEFLVVQPIEEN